MTKARDLANIGTTLGSVSTTELGYLDGVTSAIQTQIDGKQAVVSGVNSTEIGYLDGVTSAIQTQLDSKSGTSHNHDSTYVAKTLTTTTGDMIYASSADTPARLGIGSSGQVLTVSGGIPSWAAPAAGGKILQVVSATTNQSTVSSSTTFVDTNLSVNITPSSTSSRILIMVMQAAMKSSGNSASALFLRIMRDSSSIVSERFIFYTAAATNFFGLVPMTWVDSPSTTSQITYKTQFCNGNYNGAQVEVQHNYEYSSIIAMEIGA